MSLPTPKAKHLPLTDLPILLLLAVNLIGGLFTFGDYGVTWDEPLYYAYAENIPYAYSIPDRLNGTFDITRAFEPSVEDHKRYGPAYLLVGRPLAGFSASLFGVLKSDGWHLVNFLAFQGSVWLVYALARRWLSPWAAFGSAALFSTQPLLWGHGFINPKDIPFTLIILACLQTGLALVDRMTSLSPQPEVVEKAQPVKAAREEIVREASWQRRRGMTLRPAAAVIALGLLGVIMTHPLQDAAAGLAAAAYNSPPHSLPGLVFHTLATNAAEVEVSAYQAKAAALVNRIIRALAGLDLFILPLFLWLWLAPRSLHRFLDWTAAVLAPLPTWPAWRLKGLSIRPLVLHLLAAGMMLGIAVTLRIIAPLAGLLVVLYFFLKSERRSFAPLLFYALAAAVVMLALFPYLWANPVANLWDVLRHMSNNPTPVPVVFRGTTFSSLNLPSSYLPVMLALTLTEPVWPLAVTGLAIALTWIYRRKAEWRSLVVTLLLFLLPFAYVLVTSPAMYDGCRHFLFILPPIFILAGFVFQLLLDAFKSRWVYGLALAVLLAPGLAGIFTSHPYEYAYFNSLAGGTAGASRMYDTDYWLTSYREAVTQINTSEKGPVKLYVLRQPDVARQYSAPNVEVLPYNPDESPLAPGSLLLLTTRDNADLRNLPDAPVAYRVEHHGALFSVVRRIP